MIRKPVLGISETMTFRVSFRIFIKRGWGGATTIAELSGFSWFYTGLFISREILQWLLTRGFGGILGEGWAILVENLRWPNFCDNPPVP